MANVDQLSPGLLARLEDGDESALAQAFSHHRERLWQMVHFRLDARLAGRVDEDDVLQEAYLDAAKRLPHFEARNGSSIFLWLRMILAQTLVDIHRRHFSVEMRNVRREEPTHGPSGAQTTSLSICRELLGPLTTPSQAAMRSEFAAQLEAILEGMNPLDREVLALRHFEELTNRETAEVLGIQPKAASMRHMRALRRLKGLLEQIPVAPTQ